MPERASFSPSTSDVMVVPDELVPLPSKGMVYPKGSSLHLAEHVEIKAMTAKEEDILTSRALLKNGKAIPMLIRSCMVDKTVDPDDMLVGDRNAVMVAVRITGYGAEYKVEVECPSCERRSKNSFDLSVLPIKGLGEALPLETGANLFDFALPVLKKSVVFRLPTGRDDQEMSQLAQKQRAQGLPESKVTDGLLQQVVSIGDEKDRSKLASIVRSMPARDSRELRRYVDSITPGVEMKQMFSCKSCDVETEVDVPLGTEFFWPGE